MEMVVLVVVAVLVVVLALMQAVVVADTLAATVVMVVRLLQPAHKVVHVMLPLVAQHTLATTLVKAL
jgi:hypothetical protein